MAKRTLFVPTPNFGNFKPSNSRAVASLDSGGSQFIIGNNNMNPNKAIKAAFDAIPSETKTQIKDKVMNTVVDYLTQPSKGGGGGGSSYDGPTERHSSGYSLSKAPDPMEVKLDTGIVPNTYTSDFMEAKENICSPLHMTTGLVVIPSFAASDLYNFYLKVISFDIQTKAQSNVGFSLNVNTQFTEANLLTAINDALFALQIYYYYASIIAYSADYKNKNEGMIYLRSKITPAMIESLGMLARRLQDTPVPPRFLEMVRYLSANYYSGDTQGSSLLKMAPVNPGDDMVDGAAIDLALANLQTATNNNTFSLLRRSVPTWIPAVLRDVPINPIYDANFKTIFANLPFTSYNGTTDTKYPISATYSAEIPYNSYTNVLDGAAFAMQSIYHSTLNEWVPGLIRPIFTAGSLITGNSRKSFYNIGGVKKFYNVYNNIFLVRSRQETFNYTDTFSVASVHLLGTDKCNNVSMNGITETSIKTLEYLMSLDTVVNSKSITLQGKERAKGRRKSNK